VGRQKFLGLILVHVHVVLPGTTTVFVFLRTDFAAHDGVDFFCLQRGELRERVHFAETDFGEFASLIDLVLM